MSKHHLNDDIGWLGSNTAVVVTVTGHEDISLISPVSRPGVLDDPVVLSVKSSVSDSKDLMIEEASSTSALWLVVDSRGVEAEGINRGINGDSDWSNSDSALESWLAELSDVDVSLNGDSRSEIIGTTESILSEIWIVSLSSNSSVIDHPLEGRGSESSIASSGLLLAPVDPSAVDDLLLGDRDEVSGLDGPGSLDGSSRSECPARSTGTLILDHGDGTAGGPVDRSWEIDGCVILMHHGGLVVGWALVVWHHDLGEFLSLQISEVIHLKSE